MKKRALIAMSGGVDSSVSALLMKEKGYECIGVTMKLHDYKDTYTEQEKTCGTSSDVEDAKAVCDRIGIPHYVVDFKDSFKEKVMDKFVECYRCGLQNINGADGTIILEDMSAEYGEDINYVIVYYNPSYVEYICNLSVVYGDGEDEMELMLMDINFTELTREKDGINAITFNKADAEAAAKAAMAEAGYEGEYALRFAFVPVGSDGDFDYAITLTDKDITQ